MTIEHVLAETPVYYVFVQSDAVSFPAMVGTVRAATPSLALQAARETFLRREAAYDVWVVPETAIVRADHDPAYLPSEDIGQRKRYRLPSGYDNAPHWKRFKAQAMTIEEVAQDMRSKS
jgi:ring-1,2-phenylacetyl-CoA epoxidase subunit PaaB